MELKNRNEINLEYTWDLTHIFKNKDAWEKEFNEVKELLPKLEEYKGKLATSKDILKTTLDTMCYINQKLDKVVIYCFLQKSQDNGDTNAQEMNSRATALAVEYSTISSYIVPEIVAIDENMLKEWANSGEMIVYKHTFDNILRGKAHILDGEKEKILAMLGEVSQTPSDSFDMLTEVDMVFPSITDENGNKVQLTHGNYSVYRESSDPKVRQEAFNTYFGMFNSFINTITATYSGSIKMDGFMAKVKNFESSRHMSLFDANVPIEVYDNLIKSIHSFLPSMNKYLQLRKKTLNLDVLNMYDLYCPMVEEVDYPMSFENAKELVKNACKPLGDNYSKLLDKAYNEKWIDVYENKGKTTGAYSCGLYGVHPYVLLNYTDTLDDAFTLAHELGHAMHSYLSSEKQEFVNHDYKITVAEVASTVNEVLLTMYLLENEKDKKRKAYLLNHFLEGFRTTVFRQTLFAEFELKAHEMYQNNIPLTAEALSNLYKELNEVYYEGAYINDLQKVEWARIPHFYRYFYVYQYATGFCSAVAIAKTILETQEPSKYLEFLSTGGSDYPINELKIAGIDLTSEETIKKALKVFDDTVNELTQIMEEI